MSWKKDAECGVSEVVGEMLMIALVIVLLSVFSATLLQFLPADRDPSIYCHDEQRRPEHNPLA